MPTSIKPLRLPPADLSKLKLAHAKLEEQGWLRMHWPGRELHFTLNVEHRFSPPESPWPVLYCARDAATAALEIYGDRLYRKRKVVVGRSEWSSRLITPIKLPRVLVADLTKTGLPVARVDASALLHRSRNVTHAWARAVINHPDGFHGMLFHSRFTLGVCVALFQIPKDPIPVPDGPSIAWDRTQESREMLAEYDVTLT